MAEKVYRCEECHEPYLTAPGCKTTRIGLRPEGEKVRRVDRLTWGNEPGFDVRSGFRCGDCGCLPGNAHHRGCLLERCPVCFDQLTYCTCEKPARWFKQDKHTRRRHR